ncbi:MAG: response regulator [Balneolaceae bacterium]
MEKKILIAEDNYVLALVFEKMAQKMNFKVTSVSRSGEEALEDIISGKPDIILMDILLTGGMNGIDVIEKVRKKSSVPVVFITGQSNKAVYKRIKSIPNTSLVIKPISFEDLEKELLMHLYD